MERIKIIGISLIGISTLLMLISLLRKRESFFNLRGIVVAHLSLFRNCKIQYFIFYGIPLLFASGLAMIYGAGETYFSSLIIIVSILVSMLLAILSILTTKEYVSAKSKQQHAKVQQVVSETITAIIFNTVLCIFLLLYGLIMVIIGDINFDINIVKRILAGISYYCFTVILLNLLLIVKRISRIIESSFDANQD